MTDDLHDLNEKFKQSAEEFSLTPSEKVWKGVEEEIHPSRFRWTLPLVFIGVLLLAGNGIAWIIWTNSPKQQAVLSQEQRDVNSIAPAPEGNSSPESNLNSSEANKSALNSQNMQSDVQTGNPKQSLQSSGGNESFQKNQNSEIPEKSNVTHDDQRRTSGQNDAVSTSPEKSETHSNPENQRGDEIADVKVTDADVNHQPAQSGSTDEDEPVVNREQGNVVSGAWEIPPVAVQESDTVQPVVTLSPRNENEIENRVDSTSLQPDDSIPINPAIAGSENNLPAIDTIPASATRGFSISFGIEPAYSFSEFKENNDYQFLAEYRNATERDLPTMNFRIDFGYQFKYLYVYTGVHLFNFATEMQNRQVVYDYDTASSTGPVPSPPIVSRNYFDINNDPDGTSKNKFTYLTIPIGARLRVYQYQRFSLWGQWEFNPGLLISAKGYRYDFYTQEYKPMKKSDLRFSYWTLACGVHLQYDVNNRMALSFNSSIESAREIIYSDNGHRQRMGRLSTQLSFQYRF